MENEEMEDNEERTPSGTGMLDFSNSSTMEEDRLDREAAGAKKGMLDFSNSPSMEMSQLDREIKEAKQVKVHENYQKEMENIKKHGPLSRGEEQVMSEEDQQVSDLIEAENYEGLKSVVREKMEALGADYEDFNALDYYERFLASPDPEIRAEVIEIARRVIRLQKKHLERR